MRRLTLTTLALAALALSACDDGREPLAPAAGEIAPLRVALGASAIQGSYIVVLKDGADPRSVAAIMGIRPAQVYEHSVVGFSAQMTDGQLNALRHNPNVEYVETDRVVALAPPCGTPKGGPCEDPPGGGGSEVTPWGVARVNGGTTYTGSNVAWVIDSGIDLDHEDLNVDVARSVNFATGKDSPDDGHGHGTHVAGTIAAIGGNGVGVVGVAAGATVVAVRVLGNSGSGSYSGVIAGVDYVAANGANGDVANMSLGGGVSDALDAAVEAAASTGVRFTLAAGNEGDDANNHSPARANGPNVYTISAIDGNDCMPYWSNWANPPVDYAEPGVSILSTRKGGGTTTMSGTSMAAPHAAGILLLGNIRSGGTVTCDNDNDPDTIGIH